MLILLSPAKNLVDGPAVEGLPATQPMMLGQTEVLMKTTRRLSGPKLRKLMGISKEFKDGKARLLSFFANPARGMMARWAVEQRVTTAEEIRSFDVGGYVLRPELSDETRWEFERPQPPPKT